MTDQPTRPGSPSDADRKTIFAALVVMMQSDIGEAEGRARVARRLGIGVGWLLAIEEEGIANNWPPLGGRKGPSK